MRWARSSARDCSASSAVGGPRLNRRDNVGVTSASASLGLAGFGSELLDLVRQCLASLGFPWLPFVSGMVLFSWFEHGAGVAGLGAAKPIYGRAMSVRRSRITDRARPPAIWLIGARRGIEGAEATRA